MEARKKGGMGEENAQDRRLWRRGLGRRRTAEKAHTYIHTHMHKRRDIRVWAELICFRIGNNSMLLWTFGYYKR
jgi:hypothetical protein